MFELTDILYFLFVFIVGHFWWKTMQAREQAEKIAQAACKRENVQILDVTVSLKKIGFENIRLKNNGHGRQDSQKNTQRVFLRYFNFEFSHTGEDRHIGTIAMRGATQQYLYMDLPERPTIDIEATEFSNNAYQAKESYTSNLQPKNKQH